MRKEVIFLFFCLVSTLSFAQQRTVKDIEKLFKEISDMDALQNAQLFESENFLKTVFITDNTPSLNNIERSLIERYNQVAIMCNIKGKPFHCYFVKDDQDRRGVFGLDGEIIASPSYGNIVNIPNGANYGMLLVGELSQPTPTGFLQQWATGRREYQILGLFSSILVDADKSSIHNLFPNDEYVFCSLGNRGNGKLDIFTLKVIGDDALWGVVDLKGKQILPNEYTGFIRKSHLLDFNNTGLWGKWVGTKEMDMTEALNYSRKLEADIKRRRMDIANSLNTFGESMISVAEGVEIVHDLTFDAASSNSISISGSLPEQYSNWARRAESNYNSLTNLGLRHKKDGKDDGGTTSQSMSSSNYTMQKKALREAQNEMKRIRQQANKQGISITKSEYEDIQVKY